MGKGSVDTSGMERAMNTLAGVSQQALDQSKQQYQFGMGQYSTYAQPVANELMRILGFNVSGSPAPASFDKTTGQMIPGQSNVTPVGSSDFTSPMQSSLYGSVMQPVRQQIGQAQNQMRDVRGLGPVSQVMAGQEIERQGMSTISQQLTSQVSGMISSMLGLGQSMYTGGVGASQGFMGQAAGAASAMGNIASQMTQMQIQAMQSQGGLFGSIGGMIGSIGGLVTGSGGLSGLFGGGGGGGSMGGSDMLAAMYMGI